MTFPGTIKSAFPHVSSLSFLSLCIFALGCSAVIPSNAPIAAPQLQGHLHGGQQPVSGASIKLYAAGTTGYGVGAISLLSAPIFSDANGNFTITGASPCPSSTSQLYIVATGGNPGLAGPADNPSLALMAAIGPCILSGAQYISNPNAFINIDEVTTVASVYALAGFMNASTNQIGASSTNSTGIANAFQSVANLADIATGQALTTTPAGNGTVPQAKINTLADIIAPCVNSTGSGSACTALFTAATPSAGTVPTNTLQAIYNVATNPASQVAALYALPMATAPFQPTLSSAPNDWTVLLSYTGGSLSDPSSLAVDGSGNIWITNLNTTPSVTELSNAGAVLSGSTGYTGGGMGSAVGIAIDPAGNVWVLGSAYSSDNVVKLSSSGTILSGTNGYTASGMDFPQGIAIDGHGDAWVPNSNGTAPPAIFKFASNGTVLSGTQGFTAGGMNSPTDAAIDASENVWITNLDNNNVTELSNSGQVLSGTTGYTGSGLNDAPASVAIDAAGNAWIHNGYGPLTKLSNSGAGLSGANGFPTCPPVIGLLCNIPYASDSLAIDGAGNVWFGLSYSLQFQPPHSKTIFSGFGEVSNNGTTLSGATGYCTDLNIFSDIVRIDSSGNLWGNNVGTNTIVELVGAAAPVVTPLSVGVKNNTLGTRP